MAEHLAVGVQRAADEPAAVQAQQHPVGVAAVRHGPHRGPAARLGLQVVDPARLGGEVAPGLVVGRVGGRGPPWPGGPPPSACGPPRTACSASRYSLSLAGRCLPCRPAAGGKGIGRRPAQAVRVEVDADGQRGRGQHPAERLVPLVGQAPGARDGIVIGQHDRRAAAPGTAGLDPDPGLGEQVADVVGLRPVGGDQPEGVAVQAVADRRLPGLPGAAAGRLQQGERRGRAARAQGPAGQVVAAPLQGRDDAVLPRAHVAGWGGRRPAGRQLELHPAAHGNWILRSGGRTDPVITGNPDAAQHSSSVPRGVPAQWPVPPQAAM